MLAPVNLVLSNFPTYYSISHFLAFSKLITYLFYFFLFVVFSFLFKGVIESPALGLNRQFIGQTDLKELYPFPISTCFQDSFNLLSNKSY